jgi:hypothetical protein
MNKLFRQAVFDYRRYSDKKNILVYQMGKVGSSSLEASLNHAVHTHTLYGNSPCNVGELQRKPGIKGWLLRQIKFFLRRRFLLSRDEVKIITVVRDPVKRNFSMFFQELSYWVVDYINKNDPDMRYIDKNFLYDVYRESFDHYYCLEWFDKEIKRLTGIDVLNSDFDKSSGYGLYTKDKFKLLVLKAENIDANYEVIRQFVGEEFEVKRVNDSAGKWYNPVYKDFNIGSDVLSDSECLLALKKSDFSKHFGYKYD